MYWVIHRSWRDFGCSVLKHRCRFHFDSGGRKPFSLFDIIFLKYCVFGCLLFGRATSVFYGVLFTRVRAKKIAKSFAKSMKLANLFIFAGGGDKQNRKTQWKDYHISPPLVTRGGFLAKRVRENLLRELAPVYGIHYEIQNDKMWLLKMRLKILLLRTWKILKELTVGK